VLKDDLFAVLATLNDAGTSDIRLVASELARRPEGEAVALLETAVGLAGTAQLVRENDPLLRTMLPTLHPERLEATRRYLAGIREAGCRVLTLWDRDYPERLRRIAGPPLVLYLRGSVFPGRTPVAIVGTRQASRRGLTVAGKFARSLAERGVTVIGGLARGVDSAAHEAALDAGGTTLAVLAGHVDHIYPPENEALAKRVESSGALVSEVTRLAQVHKGRFVERNRITSGLSERVLIAESRRSGGTMQQARFSLAQGRPTFVIDQGEFETSEARAGFQALVAMGAVAVRDPEAFVASRFDVKAVSPPDTGEVPVLRLATIKMSAEDLPKDLRDE